MTGSLPPLSSSTREALARAESMYSRLVSELTGEKQEILKALQASDNGLTFAEIYDRTQISTNRAYPIVVKYMKQGVIVQRFSNQGTPRQRRHFLCSGIGVALTVEEISSKEAGRNGNQ